MHPHTMLREMVADRRREVVLDVATFRQAAVRSRRIDAFAVARRAVGSRLVRFGQAVAGTPVGTGAGPLVVGRRS